MPREQEPSTNERDFLLSALQENLRLDSRAFDQFRPISLTFGDEYGTADLRIGKTRVLAKVSCEVVAPYPDRKFDGIFTISTELSPMGSPAFEVGRQDQTEILLSRLLEKTVRRSGALDTESLCIIAGSKCFHLRADVHVLDHDGNLVDASCLAVIAALLHFRRPDVEIKGEDVTVFDIREREPVRLTLQHLPFCITFSYFSPPTNTTTAASSVGMDHILLQDATLLEEQCRSGSIVISMNRFGEVCQIAKYGGVAVDALSMLTCTNKALEKVKMFDALFKEQLADDERRRDVGGVMAELSAENERPMEPPVG